MTTPRFSFFSTLLPNMKDLSLGRFYATTKDSNVSAISLFFKDFKLIQSAARKCETFADYPYLFKESLHKRW